MISFSDVNLSRIVQRSLLLSASNYEKHNVRMFNFSLLYNSPQNIATSYLSCSSSENWNVLKSSIEDWPPHPEKQRNLPAVIIPLQSHR